MKIALIGYGKMGRSVEAIAEQRGHAVVARIDGPDNEAITRLSGEADVAIEFTEPGAATRNLEAALHAHVPIVTGTTGWYDNLEKVTEVCQATGGALFHATNFSIGVNLLFAVNRKLAELMNGHTDYDVLMEEIHHTQKKDAPSGTACTLAEDLLERLDRKSQWALYEGETPEDLVITSRRIGDVPGTHTVRYESNIDRLEIRHEAKNRQGFALGAVLAAEWLPGKKGVFTMRDLLQL